MLQNLFLFHLKFYAVLGVIGLIYGIYDSIRDEKKAKARRSITEPIIEELEAAQRIHDETTYNRLCDKVVAEGVDYTRKEQIVYFFTPFKQKGFEYPHQGRYSDMYGYTKLWVVIYQEWADHHPEEAKK